MSRKNETKHIVCEPVKPVPSPAKVKGGGKKIPPDPAHTGSQIYDREPVPASSKTNLDAQFAGVIERIRNAIRTPEAKRVIQFRHIPREVEALLGQQRSLREQLHWFTTRSHPDSQDHLKSLSKRLGQCRQSVHSICHLIRDVDKLTELIGHIESLREAVILITRVIENPDPSSADWQRWAAQPPTPEQ